MERSNRGFGQRGEAPEGRNGSNPDPNQEGNAIVARNDAAGNLQLAAAPAMAAALSTLVVTTANGARVTRVVPGPDGVVHLPANVTLEQIHVDGRDLVVDLPDGSKIIIVDGAAVPPQIDLGDVVVPTENLAALIQNKPQPAAGPPPSSGGDFEAPVGGIGPGLGIGGLLPPTGLSFSTPTVETLTAGIDQKPSAVIVTPLTPPTGVSAAVQSVNESGLPAGSAPGVGTTASGTIVFEAGDLPSVLAINGVPVTAIGQVINGADGTLTITSIADGVVGYTYQITHNTSGDTTHDDFTVTVTDASGDVATATLQVNINDDVPTARADTDALAAGAYGPESGNVMTGAGTTSGAPGADTQGADGAHVGGVRVGATGNFTTVPAGAAGVTIVGTYGDLTIRQDGSYTYVRHPGTPGGVTDNFSYQLVDGDGDTSNATLTISIADAAPTLTLPVEGGAGALVNEAGLATGSNPGASKTTGGTINYTVGDGPDTVTIGGTVITATGQVIHGAHGDLTITSLGAGAVGYSYTLTSPVTEPAANNGADTVAPGDTFAVSIVDQDGSTASGVLKVDVIDDVPTARADVNSVAGGSYAPVGGDVDVNDTAGADGAAVTGARAGGAGSFTGVPAGAGGATIVGAYGDLTIHQDGTYSYQRHAGSPGGVQDVFNYQLTDGDGDVSTTTLTISLGDATPTLTLPVEGGAGALVDEAGLANGSNPGTSKTTSGTISYTEGDGPAAVSIGGTAVTGVGQVIHGTHGDLTITSVAAGSIGYSYTLTSPVAEPAADNGADTVAPGETFTVSIVDQDGSTASGSLKIDVVDDVPTAQADVNSVASGSYVPVGGDVDLNDTLGADGASVSGVRTGNAGSFTTVPAGAGGVSIGGAYGDLTIHQDGTYSYARHAGTPGGVSDVFSYQLTDGDGDVSTATITISVGDDTPTLSLPVEGGAGALVNEAGLANGSNPGSSKTTSGTITYTEGDAPDSVTIGGTVITSAGQVIHGAHGDLTITSVAAGSIGYSYTLLSPVTEPTADNGADTVAPGESFAVVVTDSDGSTASGQFKIDIVDDTPKANTDSNSLAAGAYGPVGGDVRANDVQGADSALVLGVRAGNAGAFTGVAAGGAGSTISGAYGDLTVHQDGSYSYVRHAGTPGGVTDTFSYQLTDTDGDTSTAILAIAIGDATPTLTLPVEGGAGALVNEAGLANGSNPGSSKTATGTIAYTQGDAPGTVTIDGTAVTSVGQVIHGAHGDLTITSVAAGSIGYSYTLSTPITGPTADNGANTVAPGETFSVVVTDSDGSTASGQFKIDVIDDKPTANADSDSAAASGAITADGNVLSGVGGADANNSDGVADVTGADGAAVTGVAAGVLAQASGSVGTTVAGAHGSITIGANGAYTYTVNTADPAVIGLGAGASLTDTFTYTITDGDGDTATTTITITIGGTNDAPTAVADTNWTLEDAVVAINGDVLSNVNHPGAPSGSFADHADTDPDAGDVLTVSAVAGSGANVGAALAGAHGTLTLNASGTYSYQVNNADPAVQALGVGATTTDSFAYSISDGHGGTASATLTVTIFGTNDAPVAVADTNWTKQGTNLTASGNVLADQDHPGAPSGTFADHADTDVDTGDTVSVSAVNGVGANVGAVVTGAHGTLTLNANGTYTYNLNSADPAVVGLGAKDKLTDSFTYTTTDNHGATSSTTLTITIFGSNDAPVVVADTNWTLEDAGAPITGNVLQTIAHPGAPSGTFSDKADSDPDGDPLSISAVNGVGANVGNAVNGAHGALTLNANGTYSYQVNNADPVVQALGVGATTTDSFTYTAADGNGGVTTTTLTITIFGTNDAPTPVADTNWAKEETNLTASGNVLANVNHPGAPSGSFADHLDTDPDAGDTLTVSAVNGVGANVGNAVTGAHGSLTLNANGTYTYNLNNADAAVQALGVGQTITDVFNYTASDGHGGTTSTTLTITIFGTNDAPVVAADTNWTSEDAAAPITGNVLQNVNHPGAPSGTFADKADSDPDGDALSVSAVNGVGANVGNAVAGAHGTLTLNANGTYSYQVNNADAAVQALGVGATITDSFTYTASDGNGGTTNTTLTITIFGTNDAPTAVADTNWAKEDTNLTATGNVLANVNHAGAPSGSFADHLDTDPDSGDTLSVSAVNGVGGNVGNAVTGAHGSLTLNANGTYTYNLNNADAAVQALGVGQTITDTFNYTASDGHGGTSSSTLTITIFGTNDAPVVAADTNWTLEDAGAPTTGNVLQTINHPGAPSGTFGDHADTDPDGDTLSVSAVNGVGANVGVGVTGAHGTLTLNANGSYGYQVNNADAAVQALGVGASITDSFTYTASDGKGGTTSATLTITIFGTNDAPTAVADTNWAKEESSLTASGNVLTSQPHNGAPSGSFADVADTDPDTGDTLSVSAVNGVGGNVGNAVAGAHGSLTLNANGTYTYNLNNGDAAVQALGEGDTITDTFNYTASDGHGGTSTSTLTITIFGTNDAPQVTPATTRVSEEGLPGANPDNVGNTDTTDSKTSSGTVSFTDADTGDAHVVTLSAPAGVFTSGGQTITWTPSNGGQTLDGTINGGATNIVHITIDNAGAYNVTLNGPVDHPNAASEDNLAIPVGVSVSDGLATTNSTLTITVEDDSPIAVADGPVSVQKDAAAIGGNVLTNDLGGGDGGKHLTAVDLHDGNGLQAIAALGTTTLTDTKGTYTFKADGTWTFDPDNSLSIALGSVDASFTYQMKDADGDPSTADMTITVTRGAPPSGGAPVTVSVDDQNLPTGSTPGSVTDTKSPSFTAGADPITSAAFSTDVSGLGGGLNWNRVSGTLIEGWDGPIGTGVKVISLTLTTPGLPIAAGATGSVNVTATLLSNYAHHPSAGDDTQGLGSVSVIATDASAVTASDTVNVSVSDDVPHVTLTNAAAPAITVDETNLGVSANGSFAGAFTTTYGADGQAAVNPKVYSLAVSGAGVDSNLVDTATGHHIFLFSNGANQVIGKEGTDAANALALGNTVFTVDVNSTSGLVTLTQSRAIVHPNVNDPNDPKSLAGGLISITQTAKDGDGDTDAKSVDVGSTLTFLDDGPVAKADTDTASGSTVADGNVLTGIGGSDANATDGVADTKGADGATVTGVAAGVQALTSGSVGATVAGAHGSITIAAGGGYTYTVNTADPAVIALGVGATTTDTFSYTITDGDGDKSTTTITITIVGTNDAPTAVADTNWTTEGSLTAATGNVLNNVPHGGAPSGSFADVKDTDPDTGDTLTVSQVNGVGGNVGNAVTGLHGTLTLNANGTYSYQVNNADPAVIALGAGATTTDTFNYTVSDGHGGTSSSTLTVTIFGVNNAPTVTSTTTRVSEEGLGAPYSPNADALGNTDTTNNATSSGTVVANDVDAGSTLTYALTAPVGAFTSNGVAITWTGGGTQTLIGKAGATTIITVTINNSGAYTVTLGGPIDHATAGTSAAQEDNLLMNVGVSVSDGTATGTGTLGVTIEDDSPIFAATPSSSTTNNNPAHVVSIGDLHFSVGADSPGSVTNISYTGPALTSNGVAVEYSYASGVITGYLDLNNDNLFNGGDTEVFTLSVSPTGGSGPGAGSYTFDLKAALDGQIVQTGTASTSSYGAGPNGVLFAKDASNVNIAALTGWLTQGNFAADHANWLATGVLPAGDLTGQGVHSVNSSAAGFGVDNDNFSTGEFMRLDFGKPEAFEPGTVTNPIGVSVQFATFNFSQATTFEYVIHRVDANGNALAFNAGTDSGSMSVAKDANFTLTAASGFIGWIDLYVTSGNGKLNMPTIGELSTTINTTLTFSTTLQDADHDTTSGTISVTVNSAAPPVVLDLNGDGVHFLPTSAGVTYDYGDGKVGTAWASPMDGILALNDGGKLEISFTKYAAGATSDLAALSAFDTNHDGQLSDADAAFGQFGVWQDANSNGVVDAGEFKTLTASGIVSISLSSDGQGYVTAGGDVTVNGSTTFIRADGSTGVAADAAFETGQAPAAASSAKAADELRAANESYVNQGLAAGLAAATLVATLDAADHAHRAGPHSNDLGSAQFGEAVFVPSHEEPVAIGDLPGHVAARVFQPEAHAEAIASATAHHAFSEASDQGPVGGLTGSIGGFAGHGLTSFAETATPLGATGGLPLVSQGIDVRGLSAFDAGGGFVKAAASPLNGEGASPANAGAVAKILAEALHGDGQDLSALIRAVGGGENEGPGVAAPLQLHAAASGEPGLGNLMSFGLPNALGWGGGIDISHHLSTMTHDTIAAHTSV